MANPAIERRTMQKSVKIFVGLLLVLSIAAVLGVLTTSGYVGWNLTHPVREAIDRSPADLGIAYTDIEFTSRGDGLTLRGWLLESPTNQKTVVVAHGYRKNRLQNDVPALPIAKELVGQGCNVVMFDFRNSGNSEGNLTSVGFYEVQDLLGAVDYVQSQPRLNQEIVLMGFSMGASTAILAGSREPAVDAVIADSPFADLANYLDQNLSVWTELPAVPFNQAFFLIVPPLTGLRMESVSPIQEIGALGDRQLLLIHGEADADIPISNSEALAAAVPGAQLLRVPAAQHVKSYSTAPDLYLNTVSDFLAAI